MLEPGTRNFVINKNDVASITPTDSTKYILFPEQHDVPVNAKLTITFDCQLTDGDVVDIKLFRGDKEVQTSLTSTIEKQEIVASPILSDLLCHELHID